MYLCAPHLERGYSYVNRFFLPPTIARSAAPTAHRVPVHPSSITRSPDSDCTKGKERPVLFSDDFTDIDGCARGCDTLRRLEAYQGGRAGPCSVTRRRLSRRLETQAVATVINRSALSDNAVQGRRIGHSGLIAESSATSTLPSKVGSSTQQIVIDERRLESCFATA